MHMHTRDGLSREETEAIRTLMSRHTDSLVRLETFRIYVGDSHPCFLQERSIEEGVRGELRDAMSRAVLEQAIKDGLWRAHKALLMMKAAASQAASQEDVWTKLLERLGDLDLSDLFRPAPERAVRPTRSSVPASP